MARNVIFLQHPLTRHVQPLALGYCWSLLQWGAFWPLHQRRWAWCAGVLVGALLTFGVSNGVLAFVYNRRHLQELLAAGYLAVGVHQGTLEQAESRLRLRLPRAPASA